MTLKEKLCEPFGGLKTETVNELEQIADEFAIGFDNWKYNNCIYFVGWKILLGDKYPNTYSVKELLEIYKKEKGL
jgi:hypothetical protein